MMIMPANNTGYLTGYLYAKSPDKIGLLISPNGWRVPQFKMPYALDNGCFKKWDKKAFFHMLVKARMIHKPLWVCVPDAVADAETTLRRWHKYHKKVSDFGFRLAFVAQDGMEPSDVPPEAYAVFIGGSKEWKWANAEKFKGSAPLLHVGRVNSEYRAECAKEIGVISIDGTGWVRNEEQKKYLIYHCLGTREQQEWI